MNTTATFSHQPWNIGKASRAESTAPAQRYMGYQGKAPDCGENLGSCSIRLGRSPAAFAPPLPSRESPLGLADAVAS